MKIWHNCLQCVKQSVCNSLVRPVISVPNQKVYVTEGQDVAVECVVEAFPKGIHYWELGTGQTNYQIHYQFERM